MTPSIQQQIEKLAQAFANSPKPRCRDCADRYCVCDTGHACEPELAEKATVSDYIAGAKGYETLLLSAEVETEEALVKTIEEWKHFWMNQTQNSEEDRQNYFDRALGVDANMKYHLARLIAKSPVFASLSAKLMKAQEERDFNKYSLGLANAEVVKAKERIATLEQDIKGYSAACNLKDAHISELKMCREQDEFDLNAKSARIAELEKRNAELEKENETLRSWLQDFELITPEQFNNPDLIHMKAVSRGRAIKISELESTLTTRDAQLTESRSEFEQMAWDYQHLKHKGKTEEFIKEEHEKDLNSFDFHVRKAGELSAIETKGDGT